MEYRLGFLLDPDKGSFVLLVMRMKRVHKETSGDSTLGLLCALHFSFKSGDKILTLRFGFNNQVGEHCPIN